MFHILFFKGNGYCFCGVIQNKSNKDNVFKKIKRLVAVFFSESHKLKRKLYEVKIGDFEVLNAFLMCSTGRPCRRQAAQLFDYY